MSRWWKLIPLGLALPAMGGAGICGVALVDITQRELVLAPVEAISFEVDSGEVEVFAFDRNGVSLFYYMVGSIRDLGEVGHHVDGDDLDVISECESTDFCNVDWYAEIRSSVAVHVRTSNGAVKLTGVEAPIDADVDGGGFDGLRLRAPSVEVVTRHGDVALEFLAQPNHVRVEVEEGAVVMTLPPGTYRCELDAAQGELDTTGVTCDDTSTSVVHVEVARGDVTLVPGPTP